MAKVTFERLKKIEKEHTFLHEKVDSTFSVFDVDTKTVFQLDTYGKKSRKINGKISQSIQIDRVDAILLIDLLKTTFDIR